MIGLQTAVSFVEKGFAPDWLSRQGIKKLLIARLKEEDKGTPEANERHLLAFVEELRQSAIALHTDSANEQHYELPAGFFQHVLGPHLKYSACYWPEGVSNLGEAEAAMLSLTCQRAELEDGQEILELGCGWGSLTLWMAEHFPNSNILAMSNSASQRDFVVNRARERNLSNVEVITSDMNEFTIERKFDRVVSIEMFEHMRNYQKLMSRIYNWLSPQGRLFVHIFCHRQFAYPFLTEGSDNWMGRHFFTGGVMPSADLLLFFQDNLSLKARWKVNGTHYSKTARAWLENLDARGEEIDGILSHVYGEDQVTKWRVRWRLFFMACEELFGYSNGHEWFVSHYLLERRD